MGAERAGRLILKEGKLFQSPPVRNAPFLYLVDLVDVDILSGSQQAVYRADSLFQRGLQ